MSNAKKITDWTTQFSDKRVYELFEALHQHAEEHPELSPYELRFMAMTVALSDLIDVFAFCVSETRTEQQLEVVTDAIRTSLPQARRQWDETLTKWGFERPDTKLEFSINLTCPYCGTEHIMAGEIKPGGRPPEDGDATLCIKCGEVGVFAEDEPGGCRAPTIDELTTMAMDPGIQDLKKRWKEAMELHHAGPPNPNSPWSYN